ncbi:MAG TPA: hypothetical protein VGK22_22580 [Candidatus Angelobacter sp.]
MPKITAVGSEKPVKCVPRRHMQAAMFMTYDAMVAMCKSAPDYEPGDELIYYGGTKKLANLNNRSAEQEGEALNALEEAGIIPVDAEQVRFRAGRWTTDKYRVVEHDEYVKTNTCPPLRYDATGKKLKPGRLARALERKWISKITGVLWPDFMADAIADGIAATRENEAAKK